MILHNCRCIAEPDAEALLDQLLDGPAPEQPLESVKDSDLDYLRTGMRSLETHSKGYAGATPDEATAIASGEVASRTGRRFEPIKLSSDVSDAARAEGRRYILEDGRHRLAAAREAGATKILAEVDGVRRLVSIR